METLKVSEIFYSLQGETDRVGLPTVFIRLAGCPIRCHWCDTEYAFKGGKVMGLDKILAAVQCYQTPYVTVTGGEPLAQKNVYPLLQQLCDADLDVNLETGGMLSIAEVDERVCVVLDIKAPGSGESEQNLWENTDYLKPKDQIKFVLADYADYEWAKQQLSKVPLAGTVLFAPVADRLEPATLAQWILEDQLPVRFQLQLHKILWADERGK